MTSLNQAYKEPFRFVYTSLGLLLLFRQHFKESHSKDIFFGTSKWITLKDRVRYHNELQRFTSNFII